jgi:hypothetical protein
MINNRPSPLAIIFACIVLLGLMFTIHHLTFGRIPSETFDVTICVDGTNVWQTTDAVRVVIDGTGTLVTRRNGAQTKIGNGIVTVFIRNHAEVDTMENTFENGDR